MGVKWDKHATAMKANRRGGTFGRAYWEDCLDDEDQDVNPPTPQFDACALIGEAQKHDASPTWRKKM